MLLSIILTKSVIKESNKIKNTLDMIQKIIAYKLSFFRFSFGASIAVDITVLC